MPNVPHGPDHTECEPEGLAEAVAAGSLTLALMTALAFCGFAWEQHRARSAHALAVDLVSRVSTDGQDALMPPWSGLGQGPASPTARATFEVVHNLGPFEASGTGSCRLASQFLTCAGARYRCDVMGETPSGPVAASIGLCRGGSGAPWTFDLLDVTIPAAPGGGGNRADVESERDGLIRYGTTPRLPDPISVRQHRRGYAMPFVWR